MKYEQKLKFLDKILNSLGESGTHSLNFQELNKFVYDDGDKPEFFENIDTTFLAYIDPSHELGNALNYLEEDKYIRFSPPEIYLNFKGIMTLSKGGLLKEFKRKEKREKLLDNVSLTTTLSNIFSIIFAAAALVLSFLAYINAS